MRNQKKAEETEGIDDESWIFASQQAACISYHHAVIQINSV